ncbi:putative methyltransferase-domain-containing protein [Cyathus striatus]|nr:putative methyltransferase-domain-containing protein [Cyathus striatus]
MLLVLIAALLIEPQTTKVCKLFAMDASEPEDFLFDSLQTLYDYHPVIVASSGCSYTYKTANPALGGFTPLSITIHTPDTQKENWSLQASSIWMSSVFLADHLADLQIQELLQSSGQNAKLNILELGASAGLPSILVAKVYGHNVAVTASDYSDDHLIRTLSENIQRNGVSEWCKAVPYNWGSNPSTLLGSLEGFDLIIAADTLWASNLHEIFLETLHMTLKRISSSRIQLVAGMHTGRYTLQSFLKKVPAYGLVIESICEREVTGRDKRNWCVSREGDEKERRRWVVWITLQWDLKDPGKTS